MFMVIFLSLPIHVYAGDLIRSYHIPGFDTSEILQIVKKKSRGTSPEMLRLDDYCTFISSLPSLPSMEA